MRRRLIAISHIYKPLMYKQSRFYVSSSGSWPASGQRRPASHRAAILLCASFSHATELARRGACGKARGGEVSCLRSPSWGKRPASRFLGCARATGSVVTLTGHWQRHLLLSESSPSSWSPPDLMTRARTPRWESGTARAPGASPSPSPICPGTGTGERPRHRANRGRTPRPRPRTTRGRGRGRGPGCPRPADDTADPEHRTVAPVAPLLTQ